MPESACLGKSESIGIRAECLPFSAIPLQSRLFLDYLNDPLSLREYYPSAVCKHEDLVGRVPDVLASYTTDRNVLCQVLSEQNTRYGGSPEVFENIARLGEFDCVAVLTGQQAGVFTGPLYTIYKALTAIRSARILREKGVNAVPIFWIATEDHDFEEISNAFAVAADDSLVEAKLVVDEGELGKPVGDMRIGRSVRKEVDTWLKSLPATEFSSDLSDLLTSAYVADASFGDSFARVLSALFGKYGLIVFDPLDERAKHLASPILRQAIEKSDEITRTLRTRSRQLSSTGYHAQVLIEEGYVPLFWTDEAGKRRGLRFRSDGLFHANDTRTAFSLEELVSMADSTPGCLSPGVMLRPVVQDFLFPTVCYFGGSAEIAYFAQNSEVYRILGRPVTPIMHRQSFTIVESRHARTIERYGLEFIDLFEGVEKLLPKIVEQVIDPDTPRVFAEAEENIDIELNRLNQQLSRIDPTLAQNLVTRRRKIIYHIGALRKKFHRARIEKDETANRQINSMFATLLPDGALQERKLNFASFADRYGTHLLDSIYDQVDPANRDHKLLYL